MKVLCPKCDQFQNSDRCLQLHEGSLLFKCTKCAYKENPSMHSVKSTIMQGQVIVGELAEEFEVPAEEKLDSVKLAAKDVFFKFETRNAKEADILTQYNLLYMGEWQNERRHRALIQTSNMADCLPLAGQVYRHALNLNTTDKAAKQGQERILTIAMSTMSQSLRPLESKENGPQISYKKWFTILLMVGLSLFSLVTMLKLLKGIG